MGSTEVKTKMQPASRTQLSAVIGWHASRDKFGHSRVSVNTTSAHRRPVFVDCHSRGLGIDRQCTHSLHRNDRAYGLWLFFYNKTTAALLELYFNDSMQTVYSCGGGGGGSQQREVADGADVVFTDTGHSRLHFSGNVLFCIYIVAHSSHRFLTFLLITEMQPAGIGRLLFTHF